MRQCIRLLGWGVVIVALLGLVLVPAGEFRALFVLGIALVVLVQAGMGFLWKFGLQYTTPEMLKLGMIQTAFLAASTVTKFSRSKFLMWMFWRWIPTFLRRWIVATVDAVKAFIQQVLQWILQGWHRRSRMGQVGIASIALTVMMTPFAIIGFIIAHMIGVPFVAPWLPVGFLALGANAIVFLGIFILRYVIYYVMLYTLQFLFFLCFRMLSEERKERLLARLKNWERRLEVRIIAWRRRIERKVTVSVNERRRQKRRMLRHNNGKE